MAKTLAERLRDCAQGVSLGADGMGWSPDPALLEEAADKIVSLHAELQQARDGLTKGRNRMREDIERLTLELKEAREISAQALNTREREVLQGLIERELWHAKTCDAILARPDGNHRMASAQKGWDMERVALLRKLGGLGA